jgi:mono/diheme cytochrome c family protein
MLRIILFLIYVIPANAYADIAIGESLFNRSCATCHKRTAPNIMGTKLKINTFKAVVMNGRAGTMMGSFSNKYSEKEIENIYLYLSSISQ